MNDQASVCTCATCRHWRPMETRPAYTYAHCVRCNVRPGWGQLTFMPAEAGETCVQWEEKDA